MDLDFVSVHKNAKRERGQYPAILTELAWSIKYLLHDIKQGRNEVYGIWDQEPKKGWDPGSQPRGLGSQPPGSGSVVFLLDQGSGVLDQQNFAE